MASRQTSAVLRFIRRIAPAGAADALPDQDLLERFLSHRDETAFAALVERHGPLVLGVCRRVLGKAEDAEDAFQATFLVLMRKAGSICRRESVGGFLYGVASRIALKARTQRARRQALQRELQDLPAPEPPNGPGPSDFGPALDEELNRLPDRYRLPIVLCYLEGKTTAEAARQLGCARGTVLSRLARARERLRLRLGRRGFGLPAALAGVGLLQGAASAAVPAALVGATVKAALAYAASATAGGLISAQANALAKGVIQAMLMTKLRIVAAVFLAVSVLGAGAGWLVQWAWAEKSAPQPVGELLPGDPNAIRLPAQTVAKLGIRTGEVRLRAAPRQRLLHLTGSLSLDPERLARVRCRFAGEVTEVAKIQVGSRVKKGDLLAVVWSKDLADKKSELVDALVQLRLDRDILDRLQKAADAVPEVAIRNAERTVATSSNAVHRAERTLRAWRLPEEEIKALKAYADGLVPGKGKRDPEKEKAWARVEVRAPQDGVVVEKNVAQGEIVDTAADLFKVADVGRLLVVALAPEDDLPALNALKPEQRRWVIRVKADPDLPGVEGKIEQIAPLIDPNQHTTTLTGTIPNPEGRLRPGQFITATIALPPAGNELVLPASALVEDGHETIVLVQPDPVKPVYVQRRVVVVRRGQDTAHVGFPLQPGERVVTAGALELKAALDDLKAAQK